MTICLDHSTLWEVTILAVTLH